eukprot:1249787-Amphidinium_carterae.1
MARGSSDVLACFAFQLSNQQARAKHPWQLPVKRLARIGSDLLAISVALNVAGRGCQLRSSLGSKWNVP